MINTQLTTEHKNKIEKCRKVATIMKTIHICINEWREANPGYMSIDFRQYHRELQDCAEPKINKMKNIKILDIDQNSSKPRKLKKLERASFGHGIEIKEDGKAFWWSTDWDSSG